MRCLHGSIAATAAGLLVLSASASAGVIYVDDDAPLLGDGQGWETAYTYLQDALAAAMPGDEIRVAQGTYWPDRAEYDPELLGDRKAWFQMLDDVTIMGGYAGRGAEDPDERNVSEYETILSGDLLGNDQPDFANYEENSYRVVRAVGLDVMAVLDGLTIKAGNANFGAYTDGAGVYARQSELRVAMCTFELNRAEDGDGAGLYASDTDLTISGVTFRDNRVYEGSGAGLYARGSDMTIRDSAFLDNRAISGDVSGAGGGGAYLLNGTYVITDTEFERNVVTGGTGHNGLGGAISAMSFGDITLERCTFTQNEAIGGDFGGIGVNGNGGALWALQVALTMTDCAFVENRASTKFPAQDRQYTGAGGACGISTTPSTITNCRFIRNAAEGVSGVSGYGGGVTFAESTGLFVNCTFIENTATYFTGGLFIGGANSDPVVRVVNATFSGNEADEGSGAIHVGGALVEPTLHLANSIVWDNVPDEIGVEGAYTLTVDYCDVKDGWSGKGNIDADPRFVDPANGDYRLAVDSTCIDAAANNALPSDAYDIDEDTDRTERLPLDLEDKLRFADLDTKEDTGCGEPVQVDMGAYEFHGDPVHPVLVGDVDGNGHVTFDDLLEVLSAWGECVDECCTADIDFDADVGFNDLLLVLSNWS